MGICQIKQITIQNDLFEGEPEIKRSKCDDIICTQYNGLEVATTIGRVTGKIDLLISWSDTEDYIFVKNGVLCLRTKNKLVLDWDQTWVGQRIKQILLMENNDKNNALLKPAYKQFIKLKVSNSVAREAKHDFDQRACISIPDVEE